MENILKVTLERKGKTAVALFRADAFAQSVEEIKTMTAGRTGKLRWGSGAMWTVVKVEVEEAGN